MSEIEELEELAEAVQDTQKCAAAVIELRNELRRLGSPVAVEWRDAINAQRQVESAYLAIYEAIKTQSLRALR